MIHLTHSKKDLIEVISRFQLYEIEDYSELKKDKLAIKVWDVLEKTSWVVPDKEYFFVETIEELREYLRNVSTKQINSNSVKYDVVDRVRNLSCYCNGGYVFYGTNYETIHDIMVDAEFVRNFGDLPAVRRVLALLNEDVKMPLKMHPVMTRRVELRLSKLKEIKTKNFPKFHMKTGTVEVIFK